MQSLEVQMTSRGVMSCCIRWAATANGSAAQFPPELAPAEARRDRSLPYLFDAAAQPTVDEACG